MMRFAVVIEKALNNYSAYVPDLPGCISTGKTVDETIANVQEAIALHLEAMEEHGIPIPEPTTHVDEIVGDSSLYQQETHLVEVGG